MEIFKSATKLVLLALVAGLLIFTLLNKVDGETFKTALLMVLSFYFGSKTTPNV